MVLALVGTLSMGGCADAADPPDPVGTTPATSGSVAPTDVEPSTAADSPTAAQQALAPFVEAVGEMDALIADTAAEVNGLFVPQGVRHLDPVAQVTTSTREQVVRAATLIPAGLDEEVRLAALQVYQDLLNRAHALAYTSSYISSGLYALEHPDEVSSLAQDMQELEDQARAFLAFGGQSQARFAADVARLQELAADSAQPAAPVPPDSEVAGLLAFEVAFLEVATWGCNAPPAAPTDVVSMQEAWESVDIGPIEPGVSVTQAHYDPEEGWQIAFPYC